MELTPDRLRTCLRIAFGSAAGMLIAKMMNWNFGVFFTVYPMLLLGMVPVCTETPPTTSRRSIMATFLSSLAACIAAFWPAGPLPITMKS